MNKAVTAALVVLIIVLGAAGLIAKKRSNSSTAVSPTPEASALAQSSSTPTSSPVSSATPATSPSTASPTPSAAATEYVVTYGADGFSPRSLTVPAGATVQFKNESSRSIWVASNPHPSHTGYPGFDAKKGFASGQTYSFTFNNKGTWGYHDHLNSSEGGSIVVQ